MSTRFDRDFLPGAGADAFFAFFKKQNTLIKQALTAHGTSIALASSVPTRSVYYTHYGQCV